MWPSLHRSNVNVLDPFALGVATHGFVKGIKMEQLPPIWPEPFLKGRLASLVPRDCMITKGPAPTNTMALHRLLCGIFKGFDAQISNPVPPCYNSSRHVYHRTCHGI
jgi:hypothetical protein